MTSYQVQSSVTAGASSAGVVAAQPHDRRLVPASHRGRTTTMEQIVTTMPAAFFGHGSPMNALEHNRYTDAWRALRRRRADGRGPSSSSPRTGTSTPPRSPRWPGPARSTTSTASPTSCSPCEYPAPGAPERRRARSPRWSKPTLGRPRRRQLGPRPRHLVGARPRVPRRRRPGRAAVDQRAASRSTTTSTSAPGWRRCATQGVLDRRQRQRRAQPAAHRLGRARPAGSTGPSASTTPPRDVHDRRRRATLLDSCDHPDFDRAVPTPDHFIPLLYIAGLAAAAGDTRRRARRRLRLRLAVDDLLHARRGLPRWQLRGPRRDDPAT